MVGKIFVSILLNCRIRELKNKENYIRCFLLCIIAWVLCFLTIWPVKIEQYTNCVKITSFQNNPFRGTEVHFEINGEDNWVLEESGQRDMYEMVMGKEVILTYGNVYSFSDIMTKENNEWRYGGIALP